MHCPQAVTFWTEFNNWFRKSKNTTTTLTKTDLIYGVLKDSPPPQALNHLILIGKYFLFVSANNNTKYQFADFVITVREKLSLEKYIAIRTNTVNRFAAKWKNFIDLI